MVKTPACHAGNGRFDPGTGRQSIILNIPVKEQVLNDLKLLRDNLEKEAQEARQHGGTMAMKIGGRVKIIQNAIDYIESYERTEKI